MTLIVTLAGCGGSEGKKYTQAALSPLAAGHQQLDAEPTCLIRVTRAAPGPRASLLTTGVMLAN